ncbi:MAG TPA: DUF99 family protein [Thermoplasmata archaeon]|nr:DUF99 family protein [Thermoplasmata archaeon]
MKRRGRSGLASRADLKDEVRVLGVDDSPFTFDDDRSLLLGVVARLPGYVEGVLSAPVKVDGDDATAAIAKMVSQSRFVKQVRCVMLDSPCMAGFNVVDMDALHSETGIPVMSVSRDEPDFVKIEAALRKHFDDWEKRLALLKGPVWKTRSVARPVFVSAHGIERHEAERLIALSIVRGAIPEPIRLAHIIGSGIARGESRGPA